MTGEGCILAFPIFELRIKFPLMIGVGINENVVISKASMNEKDRLVIELAYASESGSKGPRNYFDESLTAGVEKSDTTLQLQILGPLVSKKDDQTREKKLDLLADDFKKLKNQLTQILQQYMLTEKIDITAAEIQYANTGITGENFNTVALEQDKADKRYANICRRFIELITPFLNNSEYALRFKLLRQSKDKHYASIPNRYVAEQPFVERMDVPQNTSNVKFTDWEIAQGLNSGVPTTTAAESKTSDPASVASASPFAAAGAAPSPFTPQQ
jgi:hypothetical protein